MASSSSPPQPQPQALQPPTLPSHSDSSANDDGIPVLAEGHIVDLLHHYGHMIVEGTVDNEVMEDHWKAIRFFWNLLFPQEDNTKKKNHGRLANRIKLAEILMMATHHPPYQIQGNDTASTSSTGSTDCFDKPLVLWNREDWGLLEQKLEQAHDSFLRKDAHSTNPTNDSEEQDEEKAQMAIYKKNYQNLMNQIVINRAVAPIRVKLEQDYKHKNWDFDSLTQEDLKELRDYVDSMENTKARNYMDEIVHRDFDSDCRHIVTMDPTPWKKSLRDQPFCLKRLKADIVFLMKSWSDDLFHLGPPPLSKFYDRELSGNNHHLSDDKDNHEYEEEQQPVQQRRRSNTVRRGQSPHHNQRQRQRRKSKSPSSSARRDRQERRQVQDLRHARANLQEAVEDPLDEARSVAEQANNQQQHRRVLVDLDEESSSQQQQERRRHDNRKSNHDHQDEEEDEIEDSEEDTPRRRLFSSNRKHNTKNKHNNNKHQRRQGDIVDDDDEEEDDNRAARGRSRSPKKKKKNKQHKQKRRKGQLVESDEEEDDYNADDDDNRSPRGKKMKKRRKSSPHPRRSSNKKKKSRDNHDDDDSDLWDDEDDDRVELSELERRAKFPKPPQKKRRFYSGEEKQALRDGLAVHGVGRWKEILDDHREVFKGRTSVNLKDLHRTMKKQGDL